ncbi:hypothetical protein BAUCODRAFT_574559 [Baudoinia panamericana UAMH 10762]|uniref:Heterokaryon incompatibility domain-containing protein n=1 Tax=Baudoinia panamericana (strain UAMH 10762) TaxID=717646 RepID=M2NHK7_BAUPA|nr:uncharacterized protein BAUCODRAFT_574559 [Baudoinia panamericana UAMH 10762]EMC98505.1 hypothetical protein BAUCODRAFT_574559 [Baudoinia panamericana UAMH 10762]
MDHLNGVRRVLDKLRINRHREAAWVYKKLNTDQQDVRVLLVKASEDRSKPVCGTLRHISLINQQLPGYETISYVWGDPKLRGRIYVDGCELEVPASTERVLRRFRLPQQDRLLWIDAVCINQQDFLERAQQVQLMAEIYSRTTHGLIWLGEDEGFAAAAKDSILAVYENARQETDGFENFMSMLIDEVLRLYRYAEKRGNLAFDHEPLLKYLGLPWFSRLWCMQEACLPPRCTCWCGNIEMDLLHVVRAAAWLDYKQLTLPFLNHENMDGIQYAFILWTYSDRSRGPHGTSSPFPPPTLYALMAEFRSFETAEPRDHVYGVLGLYQKLGRVQRLSQELLPDYRRPLDAVFRDVTALWIREWNSLEVLRYIYGTPRGMHGMDRTLDLPSWVPAWHRKWNDAKDPLRFILSFDAAGQRPVRLYDDGNANLSVLNVSGLVIGRIAAHTTTFEWGFFRRADNVLTFIKQCEEMMGEADSRVDVTDAHAHSLASRLAMTLFAGGDLYGQVMERGKAADHIVAFRDFIFSTGEVPPDLRGLAPDASRQTLMAAHSYEMLLRACINRHFFVTQDGRPGLGPRTLKDGDIVTVLYGSQWPVILRSNGGEDTYKFIRLAYVDGVMFGEAVRAHETAGKDDQLFRLV